MKSCLVVDDSRVVRKVARRILEDLQFVIDEAIDGKTAMEACLRKMPDAILLDWNMPVMNGIDFLRAAARAPRTATSRSSCSAPPRTIIEHIREAIGAGANEYIMKPFDSDILQAKFAQVGLL